MKTKQNTSEFLWLLGFLKPYWLAILATFFSLCIAAGSVLYLGQGIRILIDQGFVARNPAVLNQALILLLALVFLMALASFARSFFSSWLGERITSDIRKFAFERLLHYPPQFYRDQSPHLIHNRLHNDTTLIQVLLGGAASTGLRSFIQFLGATTFLFVSNLKLAALSCLIIPLVLLPLIIFGRRVKKEAKKSQGAEAETGRLSQESLSFITTIQAYNQQNRIKERYHLLNKEAISQAFRRILAQSLLSSLVIFLVFAAVSVLMWYGGQEVITGKVSSGEMLSFVFYAILASGSINSLSTFYGDWQRALGACSNLQDLLKRDFFAKATKPLAKFMTNDIGQIEFDHVQFNYPEGKSHFALKDFNLEIKRGETVAFVGPSGAGKSTIFNLLLRFLDPVEGRILIEGIDTKDLDLSDLRQSIGWVSQNPAIFKGSIKANIQFSSPHARDDEIIEAAKAAYAMDFITKCSHGLETELGENGINLSSGQIQRVAIARAFLKNPSILLLDEATNALDSESEFQIQKALDHLMKGRTTLIVAHRLSTVLKANRIVVMDQGQIIAIGSHTSLVRNCPIYKRFVSLQFDQPEQESIPNVA